MEGFVHARGLLVGTDIIVAITPGPGPGLDLRDGIVDLRGAFIEADPGILPENPKNVPLLLLRRGILISVLLTNR